jgi:hypothetical protein
MNKSGIFVATILAAAGACCGVEARAADAKTCTGLWDFIDELLVREQRLLTTSWASERFSSRPGIREGGRLARASRPPCRYKLNLADKAFLLAAVSLARLDVRMKRKSGQSNARQIKSRCLGMIT